MIKIVVINNHNYVFADLMKVISEQFINLIFNRLYYGQTTKKQIYIRHNIIVKRQRGKKKLLIQDNRMLKFQEHCCSDSVRCGVFSCALLSFWRAVKRVARLGEGTADQGIIHPVGDIGSYLER
jgi:hypothetical protein